MNEGCKLPGPGCASELAVMPSIRAAGAIHILFLPPSVLKGLVGTIRRSNAQKETPGGPKLSRGNFTA
jgi:hypothetical protein